MKRGTRLLLRAAAVWLFLTAAAPLNSFAIDDHWKRPIEALKDKEALHITPLKDVTAKKCGSCHSDKHSDWSTSLHSTAISPGLTGQLDHKQEPSFTEACYFCHAPLNEQSQYISTVDGYEKNPKYIRSIEGEGVTCAACHLRNGSVYGPSTNSVFKDSAFCGACHQLPDGYVLNGKLLVNTYNEWKESPYPEKNISCQSCHMPDKRHLFRGIHDKEMTRSALNITSALSSTSGIATSSLTIENTGAGHYFPTYITPLIVIEAYVETTEGKEKIKIWQVGRIANLALTEEAMDTRLKPMEKRELTFETKLPNKPFKIIFEAWVYPDEFYNRFYRSLLKSGSYKNRALIEKALHDTENSPYMLFKEVITVNNIL